VATLTESLGIPRQAVDQMLNVGKQTGELKEIGDGVWLTPYALAELTDLARELLTGSFTASECRERMATSRDNAIALLEYWEATGQSRRDDDNHRFL
jgi:selenocysteine-specific elongation factor